MKDFYGPEITLKDEGISINNRPPVQEGDLLYTLQLSHGTNYKLAFSFKHNGAGMWFCTYAILFENRDEFFGDECVDFFPDVSIAYEGIEDFLDELISDLQYTYAHDVL